MKKSPSHNSLTSEENSVLTNISRNASIQRTFSRIPGMGAISKFVSRLNFYTMDSQNEGTKSHFDEVHVGGTKPKQTGVRLKKKIDLSVPEKNQHLEEDPDDDGEFKLKLHSNSQKVDLLKELEAEKPETKEHTSDFNSSPTLKSQVSSQGSQVSSDSLIVHKEVSKVVTGNNNNKKLTSKNVSPKVSVKRYFEHDELSIDKDKDLELQRRISENVNKLSVANRNRSVSTFINQRNYLNNALKHDNKKLDNVMRRSVQRSKLTRTRHPDSVNNPKQGNKLKQLLLTDSPEELPKTDKTPVSKFEAFKSSFSPATTTTVSKTNTLETAVSSNTQKSEPEHAENILSETSESNTKFEVMLEGSVEKQAKGQQYRNWNPRYLVITTNSIIYFETKELFEKYSADNNNNKSSGFKGRVWFKDIITPKDVACEGLSPFTVFKLLGKSYVFQINTQTDIYLFSVKSQRKLDTWVSVINELYDAFKEEIVARQEMMQRAWKWLDKNNWDTFQKHLKSSTEVDIIASEVLTELLLHVEKEITEANNFLLKSTVFEAWKTYTKIMRKSKQVKLHRPSVKRLSFHMQRKLRTESIFKNNSSLVFHQEQLSDTEENNNENNNSDNDERSEKSYESEETELDEEEKKAKRIERQLSSASEDKDIKKLKLKKEKNRLKVVLSPKMRLERLNERLDEKIEKLSNNRQSKLILKRSDSKGFYIPSTDFYNNQEEE